ncbi:hypothetical protein HBB16_04140 [Pseudonocardia sp. MCCB 268]|nr:hypothetical protein [Pseudonocardia cytotoxica]
MKLGRSRSRRPGFRTPNARRCWRSRDSRPSSGPTWTQPGTTTARCPDVVGPSWKAPTSAARPAARKLIVAGQAACVEQGPERVDGLRSSATVMSCTGAPLYHNAPYMFAHGDAAGPLTSC